MKDLILITAYTPTTQHEELLERAILSVKKVGFDILLVSHSHTPLNIQKMCQYYFYDHLNDVTDNVDFRHFEYFSFPEFQIQSKYFTKNFYGFSIYRMFSIASKIAKNFDYERMYHMEYDCEVFDQSIFMEHQELLQTHDAVFYTAEGHESDFLVGCFKSFKVDSLPETFANYDKNHITDVMINAPCKPLENYTKRIFQGLNTKFLDSRSIFKTERFVQDNLTSRKKHFTLYYHSETKTLNFFYRNMWEEKQKVIVITNGELINNIDSEPGYFNIRPLCPINEFREVRVFVDDNFVYEFKVDNQEQLDTFKQNAFSSLYEKDN